MFLYAGCGLLECVVNMSPFCFVDFNLSRLLLSSLPWFFICDVVGQADVKTEFNSWFLPFWSDHCSIILSYCHAIFVNICWHPSSRGQLHRSCLPTLINSSTREESDRFDTVLEMTNENFRTISDQQEEKKDQTLW